MKCKFLFIKEEMTANSFACIPNIKHIRKITENVVKEKDKKEILENILRQDGAGISNLITESAHNGSTCARYHSKDWSELLKENKHVIPSLLEEFKREGYVCAYCVDEDGYYQDHIDVEWQQ